MDVTAHQMTENCLPPLTGIFIYGMVPEMAIKLLACLHVKQKCVI